MVGFRTYGLMHGKQGEIEPYINRCFLKWWLYCNCYPCSEITWEMLG
jgi:hypothetical protein